MSKFEFYPCRLDCTPAEYAVLLPNAMLQHLCYGGNLYAIAEPVNGHVCVSTHPNPLGHVCTFVPAQHVVKIAPGFIKTGAKVCYVNHNSEDEPYREAVIDAIYEDNSADLDDPHLGKINVDFKDIFPNKAAAMLLASEPN